jgi:Flp pilus assembly protein TadG
MVTKKRAERGQALILIVLAIVGLIGLTALSIDGGNAFMNRRHAQASADAAALAAGLAKLNSLDWYGAGMTRAYTNGYTNDGVHSTVTINNPPSATDCNPNDAASPYVGNNEYIQVIIHSTVDTYFATIVGVNQTSSCVESIARAKSGNYTSAFNGAGMVGLKPTGSGTIGANGNVTLDINNAGLFDNSSSACAFNVNGNAGLSVDTAYQVVGTFCKNGNVNVSGPVQSATQVKYPPDISFPAPTISCSGTGSLVGNTYQPGNYSSISINGNGSYSFAPGNYCVTGGISVNGNTSLSMSNINMKLSGGSFSINGNSYVNCSNFLFYSTGGSSGVSFNGNASNACTDVTFFLETGGLSWNGNVANTFAANSVGPYANLLVYMPYGNNSALTINGNSGNQIRGTIMGISAPITINGNSGTTTGFHSQIIGYTITLNGNSNTVINFDAAENVLVPDPPTLDLAR